MLLASVITFSPRVCMGSGIPCFFKKNHLKSTTCRDVSSDLYGTWSYFPFRCFSPFSLRVTHCSPTPHSNHFRILARPLEKFSHFVEWFRLQSETFLTTFFFKSRKKKSLEFPLYFFILLCILFLPVFIEKRRFLKPKMSSFILIAVCLWFNWPRATMLVEIRDSPTQESCLWQQLILKRKKGKKMQKEKKGQKSLE